MKRARRFWAFYIESYSGLSRNSWMLALVALINRSGSMVLPFLGLYLREAKAFDLSQVAVLLAIYGVGSAVGAILGGTLTDTFGAFRVQFSSLFLGGLGFIGLSFVEGYYPLLLAVFLASTLAESFRPANMSAVTTYARPENIARAVSINRLAINLGFAIGPAIGGILAEYDYRYIFWFDGATCIAASMVFYSYFVKQQTTRIKAEKTSALAKMGAVFKDLAYIKFISYVVSYAFLFFQLFNSIPLYFKNPGGLGERQIGYLFALNGALVFLLEMPLVAWIQSHMSGWRSLSYGFLFAILAFVALMFPPSPWVFVLCFMLLSVSEILALPFTVSLASGFTTVQNRGSYMGVLSLGFALTHILAPTISLFLAEKLGFSGLWLSLGILGMVFAFWGWKDSDFSEDLATKPE